MTKQEHLQDNSMAEFERNEVQFSESPRSYQIGKSIRMKIEEEGKMRTLSGRVINCQGKNVKINIPLTMPSHTLSVITFLVWDDLINQSMKGGPEGNDKLNINKKKLHHAEKMIRGDFTELYKGLGSP
uniref:Uncharacterized protein n=1 Tax=Nelumbo nucifera TaxID=4432 RepID=A0A822YNL1_NELNU|nr:TPA_asm: hypothetical protein HUJ06_011436 [Nelumbo nucifera]